MIDLTVPSPSHDEAMERYRRTLDGCADFDPPPTPEEQKRILDACLTGDSIFLRCTFSESRPDAAGERNKE